MTQSADNLLDCASQLSSLVFCTFSRSIGGGGGGGLSGRVSRDHPVSSFDLK